MFCGLSARLRKTGQSVRGVGRSRRCAVVFGRDLVLKLSGDAILARPALLHSGGETSVTSCP